MRAVVEALRAFPIQVDYHSAVGGRYVTAECHACHELNAWAPVLVFDRAELVKTAVEWLREHQCYCNHIQSWSSRECILCGQSLL